MYYFLGENGAYILRCNSLLQNMNIVGTGKHEMGMKNCNVYLNESHFSRLVKPTRTSEGANSFASNMGKSYGNKKGKPA